MGALSVANMSSWFITTFALVASLIIYGQIKVNQVSGQWVFAEACWIHINNDRVFFDENQINGPIELKQVGIGYS